MKHAILAIAALLVLGIGGGAAHAAPLGGGDTATVETMSAPVDPVARAKFPKSNPVLVDQLAAINRMVNATITYVSDEEHYGLADYWVMLPADGKGDCEDYAISKMELIRRGGWPTVAFARLRSVIVGIEGHAILELLMPSGEHMFLDNGFPEPMTRPELEARGYKFFDW